MKSVAKRVAIKPRQTGPRSKRISAKGIRARAASLGRDIIKALAGHMNRLGLTPAMMAEKTGTTVHRFLTLTARPWKLDLRTISAWSSVIGVDLVVSPMFPQGYFGRGLPVMRDATYIKELGGTLKNFLISANQPRIINTSPAI